MKKILTILPLLLLASCTPPDISYCNSFHIPADGQEYAACRAYYSKMEQWFAADMALCRVQADATVPEYLYDHPHYGRTTFVDHHGVIRENSVLIEPDYIRNQALDAQRQAIIAPCMSQKGWKSANTWQAGRINSPPPSQFKH